MTEGGPAQPVSLSSLPTDGGPAVRVAVVTDGRPVLAGPSQPIQVVLDGRPVQGNAPIPIVIGSGSVAAGPAMPVVVVSGSLYLAQLQALAPIALYPQNEVSGATIVDNSGNGRNGTYSNVTLGGGGIGDGQSSATYNGTTSYGNIYSTSLRDAFNAPEGTVCFWMRVAAGSVWTDSTIRRMLILQADSNNRIILNKDSVTGQLQFSHIAGATNKTVSVVGQYSQNWLHIALTWNKAQDRAVAYLNGVQTGATQTGLGTWAGSLASTTTVIGASNTTPAGSWNGRLAYTALFNRELTAVQIADLHTSGRRANVIFEGDSRTVGNGTVQTNYPSQCSGLIAVNAQVRNVATASETVATMITQIAAQITANKNTAIPRNVAVAWGGINDAAGGANAATIATRIQQWSADVAAAGITPFICTEIDAQSVAMNAVGWNTTIWPALNAALRASIPPARLIDLGADARLQNALDTTYFNADRVHLNATGDGVVAGIAATALAGYV